MKKRYFSLYLIFFILLGINKYSLSQNYKYVFLSETKYTYEQQNIDTSITDALLKIKNRYINRGYLGVSIDSVSKVDNTYTLYIYKGLKYKLERIHAYSSLSDEYKKIFFVKPVLTLNRIEKTNNKILSLFQDRGYPYVILNKDILFNKNRATIEYNVTLNQYVLFDSIKIFPENTISYNYISKITGIEYNKPFNASALNKLNNNINQEKIFKLDSALVSTNNSKTYVTLKLTEIKQNSFTGLIGMQTNDKKETEITGNVFISLLNSFKQGEEIKLKWQKPKTNSQQLETNINIPYIFKLPIGLSFYGNFDKNDTLFTNTHFKLGLLIPIINYGKLSVNGKWDISSVSSSQDKYLTSTKSTLFGIGYSFSKMDNIFAFKKGIILNTEMYLGNNSLINTGNNTTIFECTGKINTATPLPIGVINIKNQWGVLKNDSIKINNIYRIGGIKTIRGFNERSIYSKLYSFINTEYQFYIDNLSYMYLLYDVGVFNEPVGNKFANIWRQSIGVGLNINTKAGVLSIVYAVGKTNSNPFLLNNGQVYIGYINRF